METIGEKLAKSVDDKVKEIIKDGGYGKVTVEVTIRHSKPEYLVEKTQTRPVNEA